jgi:uncharacterized glyoxalase superfamily protein PhnB
VSVLDSNLRYLSAFPTVDVPDLEVAAEWYRAAFGFAPLTSGSDDNSRWIHLRRGEGQDLVLRAAAHPHVLRTQMVAALLLSALGVRQRAASTYIAVDQVLQEATDIARRAGAKLIRGGRAQRGEASAATLRDPYGYEWVLFSRTTSGGAKTPKPKATRRWTRTASFKARWRIWLRR